MLSLNHITETFLDFPDGESLSVIVFFNGCIHNCPGCQNPELQKENLAQMFSIEEIYEMIRIRCERNRTNKVVLSGGDPFFNPEEIIQLIDKLEESKINVCSYTGYTIENIDKFYQNFEKRFNRKPLRPSFVKCGVYIENMRDNAMGKKDDKFILASTNQAFYAPIYEGDSCRFNKISKGHILYF